MSQEEHRLFRELRQLTVAGDMQVGAAALELGLTVQRATFILRRGKVTPTVLKARRKAYIVDKMTDKKSGHRHTPHVISRYFKVEESYIRLLIKELREEGRLPPLKDSDKEWQDDLVLRLQRRYRRVYRPAILPKAERKRIGDKVYVDSKGWITWDQARALLEKSR